jgi:hypothetical protein
MNRYRCRICDWTGELPEDAVLINHGEVPMYTFGGLVHALSPIRRITENQHNNWHRQKKVLMCTFCFPEPQDHDLKQTEPQSVPQAEAIPPTIDPEQDHHGEGSGTDFEHLQEDPVVPEDTPVVEEHPGSTSMAAAFNRLFRQQEEEPDWRDDSTAKF